MPRHLLKSAEGKICREDKARRKNPPPADGQKAEKIPLDPQKRRENNSPAPTQKTAPEGKPAGCSLREQCPKKPEPELL